jgi:hypothetical protein
MSEKKKKADGTVVELSEPIEVFGEIKTELVVQRAKVKHLKAVPDGASQIRVGIELVAACANIPPSALDEVSLEDFEKLSKAIGAIPLSGGHGSPSS